MKLYRTKLPYFSGFAGEQVPCWPAAYSEPEEMEQHGTGEEAPAKGAIALFPEFWLLKKGHFSKVNQQLMKPTSRRLLIGNDQFSSHLHANR